MICTVALSLAASPVADARRVRAQPVPALAGSWASTYGTVTLTQTGNRIHGEYACCGGGTLDGYVANAVIRFHWREPRGAGEGEGVWRVQRDGTLQGSWGLGQSDSDGAAWNLWRPGRSSQMAQ